MGFIRQLWNYQVVFLFPRGLSILEFALICVFCSFSLVNYIFRLNIPLLFHYLFLFSSLNSIQPGKPLINWYQQPTIPGL